mmetsp:Transcript_81248/g.263137  ORF Transcript_81248/g.263137 Transcript_81248/m.263137 type:complete len:357 (+) Transcript_81248:114-1184(+)
MHSEGIGDASLPSGKSSNVLLRSGRLAADKPESVVSSFCMLSRPAGACVACFSVPSAPAAALCTWGAVGTGWSLQAPPWPAGPSAAASWAPTSAAADARSGTLPALAASSPAGCSLGGTWGAGEALASATVASADDATGVSTTVASAGAAAGAPAIVASADAAAGASAAAASAEAAAAAAGWSTSGVVMAGGTSAGERVSASAARGSAASVCASSIGSEGSAMAASACCPKAAETSGHEIEMPAVIPSCPAPSAVCVGQLAAARNVSLICIARTLTERSGSRLATADVSVLQGLPTLCRFPATRRWWAAVMTFNNAAKASRKEGASGVTHGRGVWCNDCMTSNNANTEGVSRQSSW